jgi:asparagine synthetase B (glutamine-hydrolysing)
MIVGEGADEIFGGYGQFRRLSAPWARFLPDFAQRYRAYRDYTWCQYGPPRQPIMERLRELLVMARGDWFHAVRLFETQHQLPANLNMKVDRASMAASVEARVPYQDRRVVEFAFRMPRHMLIGPSRNKLLLRRVAQRHNLLPESVFNRPKYGTMIPYWMDYHEGFRKFASDIVLRSDGWARRLGLETEVRRFFLG